MGVKVAALSKLILRLEVSHVVFGGMCFGRVMYYTALTSEEGPLLVPGKLLFFLFVTFAMLLVSVVMFLACLLDRMAEGGEKHYKSIFEILLYGLGCFLYLMATVSLIIYIADDTTEGTTWSAKWASFVGAAMFSCWNTITYSISLWMFVKLRSAGRLELKDSDSPEILR